MTTRKSELLEQYALAIEPLLPLAQRAYGSRDTVSPQHDASREMTRLLKEFYNADGSLLDMAARLGVNYAGLRRRVTTADTKPSSHRARKKFPQEVYDAALQEIRDAKATDKDTYHRCLYKHWAAGLSMSKIAKELKLSSANPLYYGINRIKALEDKVN